MSTVLSDCGPCDAGHTNFNGRRMRLFNQWKHVPSRKLRTHKREQDRNFLEIVGERGSCLIRQLSVYAQYYYDRFCVALGARARYPCGERPTCPKQQDVYLDFAATVVNEYRCTPRKTFLLFPI